MSNARSKYHLAVRHAKKVAASAKANELAEAAASTLQGWVEEPWKI